MISSIMNLGHLQHKPRLLKIVSLYAVSTLAASDLDQVCENEIQQLLHV